MQVDVRVLGGLSVSIDGRVVDATAWKSRRSAQLVALLALAANRRLATEQVMDALWPELAPEAARANLHKTATLARQAMGAKESVVLRGETVALWPEADAHVDVAEFERDARLALASRDREKCARVASRVRGEVLPEERYEEWAVTVRDRVHRMHLELLRAGHLWAALAEADPTDEAAHRALMAEHLEAGRLHAAIRQFQRLRTILARELGVLPATETSALYRRILGTAQSGWVRPGLAGREIELVRARATLRRAAEGRPAALFVTGPAGIGKTRLCEELIEQAAADGWAVLRATGREQTASVPYAPLIEAVQAALIDRPDAADALDEPDRSLLVRLSGLGPEGKRRSIHRHAVLSLVSRVLAGTGASRSLLFLDDLHHVDDDTVALAEVLASASIPRGVLLIGAYRPDVDGRAVDVARAMVGRGVGAEVSLGPLSRSETEHIVGEVLTRRGSDVEMGLAWELSEGNPFFALEIASALSADEETPHRGAYSAVDVRLGSLAAEVRSSLGAVALVVHEFTADEYAALAELDADRALDHLESAMSAGVVARQGASYRFRHDLVRDRLTQAASADERATAHAHAADRLAGLEAPAARVVHHWLAAGRNQEALPWLRKAATEAVEIGAHAEAMAAIDRALEIVPRDPSLLALRADAMNGMGDPGAPAAYSLAMALSDEAGRAALAVRRTKALILAGDIPAALETLATVADVPPDARAQLLVAQGLASWCTGALDEAEEAGLAAKRRAEETGSVRDFVDATMVLAMVAHERGTWPQRVSLDLLDRQLRPDLASVVMDAHLCVAESYLYGGVPYPEVIAFARDLQRQALASGAPRAEAFATTLSGEAHLLMGDTATAADQLRTAAEQHRRVGVLCGEALSLQRLAQAVHAEGRDAEAQAALTGALIAARGTPVGTRHLLDRIHGTAIRAAPDPEAGLAAVDEAARAVRGPFESCPPCSVNLTIPAAIACSDGGDHERAAAYLQAAEQIVGAFYPRGGWQAALDEVRGHVARAEGDTAAAERLLSAAAEAFEHWGQRLDAARCRQALDALTTAGTAGTAGKV